MLILLLPILSCSLFTNAVKPTQVVDLSPMLGKSLEEMTAKLGPSREQGLCYAWDLPEGVLSVCYQDGDHQKKLMESLHYRFPSATLFAPGTEVSSPAEMAALVKIDLQDRKPDTTIRGGYGYDNYTLNGKAVDLFFDGGPNRIVGVRVDLKSPATSPTNAATASSSPAPSAADNSQTNTSTAAPTAGVTMANFNRLEKGMTYAQAVQILGKEGKRESVMEAGGMKIEMYKWDGEEEATMSVFFKDGKLDTKFQFDLK